VHRPDRSLQDIDLINRFRVQGGYVPGRGGFFDDYPEFIPLAFVELLRVV
jgi:hypothetical protein